MSAKGKASNKIVNLVYVLLLVFIILFMIIWRFFGIEALDTKIEKGVANYPVIAGLVGLVTGVLFTWLNAKEHSASGGKIALIDYWRALLLTAASAFVLLCAVTL